MYKGDEFQTFTAATNADNEKNGHRWLARSRILVVPNVNDTFLLWTMARQIYNYGIAT